MRKLRDFASISDFLSDRKIDELQAAVDARREARAGRAEDRSRRVPSPDREAQRDAPPLE